jgi:hypothetical protein
MFPFTLTISLHTVVIISRLPDGITDVSIFSVKPELASWIYFIDFMFSIRRLTSRRSQCALFLCLTVAFMDSAASRTDGRAVKFVAHGLAPVVRRLGGALKMFGETLKIGFEHHHNGIVW